MTTTHEVAHADIGSRAGSTAAVMEGVYLVAAERVAVLPVEQAGAMVNVAAAIAERAQQLGQADRVADLTGLAQRLSDAMQAAVSSAVRIDIDETLETTMIALLAQARARAALAESSRFRHVCTTCGMSNLTNPDFEKLIEHNRRMSTLTRGVGMALFTGGVTPFFMLNSLLGLRKSGPEYHCPRCQGMDADTTVVVFCPACKTQCDKAVLKACSKCHYDFLQSIDVNDVWHALDAVVIPAPAGEKLTELRLDDEPTRIGFLYDGNYMLTASQARSIQLWHIGDSTIGPRVVWSASVGGLVKVSKPVVAFSSDGRWVATGKPMSRSFELIRANDGVEVGRVDWAQVDGWGPSGLAFRPDSGAVAVAYDNIDVWALSATGLTKERLARLKVSFMTTFESVAFSGDGAYIAAAGGKMGFNQVFLWQTADWAQVAKIPMHGAISDLTWSPTSMLLAVAVGNEARLIEMPSGRQLAAFSLDGAVTDVDFNVDATLLAAGSDDHSARIYDLGAGTEAARVSRPFGVTAVTFAPDGRLAVGDAGNTVEFWSPPSKG